MLTRAGIVCSSTLITKYVILNSGLMIKALNNNFINNVKK